MWYFLFVMLLAGNVWADTRNLVLLDCNTTRTDPIICTACNIYHEARGEGIAGQVAVALVTKNRVKAKMFPNTYCEVVWEARRNPKTKHLTPMFSWTRDGRHDRVYNKTRWYMALKIADQVINKDIHDFTAGSLWFHSTNVSPYWKNHYQPTILIDGHQFYTVDEDMFHSRLLEGSMPAPVIHKLQQLYDVAE